MLLCVGYLEPFGFHPTIHARGSDFLSASDYSKHRIQQFIEGLPAETRICVATRIAEATCFLHTGTVKLLSITG